MEETLVVLQVARRLRVVVVIMDACSGDVVGAWREVRRLVIFICTLVRQGTREEQPIEREREYAPLS